MGNPEQSGEGQNTRRVPRESLVEFYDPETGKRLPRKPLADAIVSVAPAEPEMQTAYDEAAAMGHDIEDHLEG